MKLTRREFLHLSTAAAVAGGVTLLPVGQAAALAAPSVQQLVEEAYLYAFPLVLMDATKIVRPTPKRPRNGGPPSISSSMSAA